MISPVEHAILLFKCDFICHIGCLLLTGCRIVQILLPKNITPRKRKAKNERTLFSKFITLYKNKSENKGGCSNNTGIYPNSRGEASSESQHGFRTNGSAADTIFSLHQLWKCCATSTLKLLILSANIFDKHRLSAWSSQPCQVIAWQHESKHFISKFSVVFHCVDQ